MDLYREGRLLPTARVPTFGEFAEGWWDIDTCLYTQWKALRRPLTASTIDMKRGITRRALVPRFGDLRLTFHGWRHFFNTVLRMANVSDSKIREVTGHQSAAMTDLYTHFKTREFREVAAVQDGLFTAGAGEGDADAGAAVGEAGGVAEG